MTRRSTKKLVDRIAEAGENLGLTPHREVSPCAALDGAYAPRTDLVLAGDPLKGPAADAIVDLSKAAGVESPLVGGAVPVLGVEVEGTDPTSKTLEADTVNLWVCRYPLAALVTDSVSSEERGEPRKNSGDIHPRAQRLVRTFELFDGPRPIAVFDAADLVRVGTPRRLDPPEKGAVTLERRGNRGGTTQAGARILRRLAERGEQLGFRVGTDVPPPITAIAHEARTQALKREKAAPDGPLAALLGLAGAVAGEGRLRACAAAGRAFTRQAIDVVWGIDAPPGALALHAWLGRLDPAFAARWPRPPFGPHLPLIAFEVETKVDKHTAGSLLHLARVGALGVLVVPDDLLDHAGALLSTYRSALALGPVAILGFGDVR